MEEIHSYKGHRVRVCAVRNDTTQEIWDVLLFIDGVRQLRPAVGGHPRVFSSPRGAIAHGKETAEDLIDNAFQTKE
jgi:hypothetical protein